MAPPPPTALRPQNSVWFLNACSYKCIVRRLAWWVAAVQPMDGSVLIFIYIPPAVPGPRGRAAPCYTVLIVAVNGLGVVRVGPREYQETVATSFDHSVSALAATAWLAPTRHESDAAVMLLMLAPVRVRSARHRRHLGAGAGLMAVS